MPSPRLEPAAAAAVAKSFLDLTSLVASDSARSGTFDDLAYQIGSDAYADLNGWHLFLKDMTAVPGGPKMHSLLADQIGTQILTTGRYDDRDVEDILKKVPVKLGSGKATVSLDSVLPNACVRDIQRACEEFERRM
eukprot:NODE_3405_length_983_cov_5.877944_g3127_i0.p2 GENE.NODE_3405_length_983_cov_5.877944_g3127_i0~~NODE_3405_length_983_cov_5.877944_g3127_i0.p2  ORF type:complete len:136 (-),score=19.92 NODE_3405_length_983_cov_5.877944_g3127_i0:197-604(-)